MLMDDSDFITSICKVAEREKATAVNNGKMALQGYSMPTEWKSIVQHVAEMRTPEEAVAASEDVELLESLLLHAHEYGNKASEYCVLEAKTYVRIASLYQEWSIDDKERFRQISDRKTWRMVEWVMEKSNDDLAWIFSRVAEGRRLETVRRDEMAVTRKMMKQDKYAATATRMVESFKQHGEATINIESFCDSFVGRGEVDAKTACVWIDQARKEVRKLGGIGLGGGNGKYIAVTSDNDARRKDIAVAILNRLRSIEHDLIRMGEICMAIELEPPTKEIKAIVRAAEAMVIPITQEEEIGR